MLNFIQPLVVATDVTTEYTNLNLITKVNGCAELWVQLAPGICPKEFARQYNLQQILFRNVILNDGHEGEVVNGDGETIGGYQILELDFQVEPYENPFAEPVRPANGDDLTLLEV